MNRRALGLLGAYYVATGVWPIVHMRSFMAVTGPKTDRWLVKTVGALALANGAVLVNAALRKRPSNDALLLAVASAAAFSAIDVVYVLRGTLRPIYLADAVAEGLLIAAIAGTSDERSTGMSTSEQAAQTSGADQELRGGVVPFTMVTDANAAAAFYKEALGAEEIMRAATDDGSKVMHCHLRINGGSFVVNDAFPEHGHPYVPPQNFTLHLQVDDVDAWWKRATAAGMEIVMPLELQFWGDRYGILRDRFGITWSMGSHAK